ncbi:MAG: hypothetical protein ACR2PG_24665 [Hyphomicrobiaceae bacterium]
MPDPVLAAAKTRLPKTLHPASLWKRAVLGLLVLGFGVVAAAWLLHASIEHTQSDLRSRQHVSRI